MAKDTDLVKPILQKGQRHTSHGCLFPACSCDHSGVRPHLVPLATPLIHTSVAVGETQKAMLCTPVTSPGLFPPLSCDLSVFHFVSGNWEKVWGFLFFVFKKKKLFHQHFSNLRIRPLKINIILWSGTSRTDSSVYPTVGFLDLMALF